MTGLRALLLKQHTLALALVLLALVTKALIPAGYMPSATTRSFTIQLCSEGIPGRVDLVRTVVVGEKPAPGVVEADHAKAQGLCPFSALGHAATGGVDIVLLAAALAFVLLLGFAATVLPPRRHLGHLRPFLRGPPLIV